MKLLLENWREYLREEQGSSVIAHLVGQAGSGKTYFIENTLLKKYPEIIAKDLDDFDDAADKALGLDGKTWRQSGDSSQIDQRVARKHFDTVQGMVNQFLSANQDKKVFLAGMSVFPWVEGNNELDLGSPMFKFYLDIDPQVSAKRRIARDVEKGLYGDEKPTEEEFQNELKWAADEKAQLLSAGYKSTTPEEIVKAVDGVMQGEQNETPT